MAGGEFAFSEDSYGSGEARLAPKCGRMVAFTSGYENLHGVYPTLSTTSISVCNIYICVCVYVRFVCVIMCACMYVCVGSFFFMIVGWGACVGGKRYAMATWLSDASHDEPHHFDDDIAWYLDILDGRQRDDEGDDTED